MLCSSITKKYDMNCSTSVFSYINWIILHYCEVMGYCFIQFVMAFNSLGVWGVADVISVVYVTLGVRYNFLLERCLQLKVFWWAVVLTLYLASGGKAGQGRHVQMTPFLVNNWALPKCTAFLLSFVQLVLRWERKQPRYTEKRHWRDLLTHKQLHFPISLSEDVANYF